MRARFFVDGIYAIGARVVFAPDDAHKLVNVLRRRSGDRVDVVDSSGAAFAARLAVAARVVTAELESKLDEPSVLGGLEITVAQAIPKGSKMDYVVEKATELGVRAIVPVRSARVIGADRSEAKVERWRRIARMAAQQSGRSQVPSVHDVVSWAELVETFGAYDRVYVPWELAEPRAVREIFDAQIPVARRVLVAIGPEGGFAADEVAAAEAAGAVVVSLGRRILRTETAALVVLSIFAYVRGDS